MFREPVCQFGSAALCNQLVITFRNASYGDGEQMLTRRRIRGCDVCEQHRIVDVGIRFRVQQNLAFRIETLVPCKVQADGAYGLCRQRLVEQLFRNWTGRRDNDLLGLNLLAICQAYTMYLLIINKEFAYPCTATHRSSWQCLRELVRDALYSLCRKNSIACRQHLKGELKHACAGG